MKPTSKRMGQAIAKAEALGFEVSKSSAGHYCYRKPGCRIVFSSSTPSCPRFEKNLLADLRRASKEGEQDAS